LIADASIAALLSRSAGSVRVGSPDGARLGALLTEAGGRVDAASSGVLTVQDLEAPAIGEIAARHGIVLHELTPEHASLEEAFFELTDESVEFQGGAATAPEVAR